MEKNPIGSIYKITVGQNAIGSSSNSVLSIELGQEMSAGNEKVHVSHIMWDEPAYYHFGVRRYIVYAKTKTGVEYAYRVFDDMPVSLICSVPKEEKIST